VRNKIVAHSQNELEEAAKMLHKIFIANTFEMPEGLYNLAETVSAIHPKIKGEFGQQLAKETMQYIQKFNQMFGDFVKLEIDRKNYNQIYPVFNISPDKLLEILEEKLNVKGVLTIGDLLKTNVKHVSFVPNSDTSKKYSVTFVTYEPGFQREIKKTKIEDLSEPQFLVDIILAYLSNKE